MAILLNYWNSISFDISIDTIIIRLNVMAQITAFKRNTVIEETHSGSMSGHPTLPKDLVQSRMNAIRLRIEAQGDLPHVSVSEQISILEQLNESPLGQYICLFGSLDAYWAQYVIMYAYEPDHPRYSDINPFEMWLLKHFPSATSTQERFKIFQELIKPEIKDHAVFASVPCGLMDDLLTLDYSDYDGVTLIGIDIDSQAVSLAKENATLRGSKAETYFHCRDAWSVDEDGTYDLITSNGLNIYEYDDNKVTELYHRFYRSIKKDGCFVGSFLTPSPLDTIESPWKLHLIEPKHLRLQKILLQDILKVRWSATRTKDETLMQLRSVGFQDIEFHDDRLGMFPSFIARK